MFLWIMSPEHASSSFFEDRRLEKSPIASHITMSIEKVIEFIKDMFLRIY